MFKNHLTSSDMQSSSYEPRKKLISVGRLLMFVCSLFFSYFYVSSAQLHHCSRIHLNIPICHGFIFLLILRCIHHIDSALYCYLFPVNFSGMTLSCSYYSWFTIHHLSHHFVWSRSSGSHEMYLHLIAGHFIVICHCAELIHPHLIFHWFCRNIFLKDFCSWNRYEVTLFIFFRVILSFECWIFS